MSRGGGGGAMAIGSEIHDMHSITTLVLIPSTIG